MSEIKCWAHEIRDPDCPKCRSEATPEPTDPAGVSGVVAESRLHEWAEDAVRQGKGGEA